MTVVRKRYAVEITVKATGESKTVALYDSVTGEGTSGEGKAFAEAKKIANTLYKGERVLLDVFPVKIKAEIDIEKAVKAGAVGAWSVVNGNETETD